jgi:hypothetical protein
MMKPTDARERNYLAGLDRLYRSGIREFLVQRQVRPAGMIVLQVLAQDSAQMTFVQNDDVVDTVTSNRTNDSLDIGILPGRARCDANLVDT